MSIFITTAAGDADPTALDEAWRTARRRAARSLLELREGSGRNVAFFAVDVFEQDNKLHVQLEAPGLERDDFDITVGEQEIVISGTRKPRRRETALLHLGERGYGQFRRQIDLPFPVNADQASASYESGVLQVVLPKRRDGFCRRIEVQGE